MQRQLEPCPDIGTHSENTFFDAFSNNNCSCKICTNLNKNIDKIKNVKLNYLMNTINL